MNCEFLDPIDLGDATTSDWEFSTLNCTTTKELITSPEYPERNFYLDKTFSYGDIFFIFIIVMIMIFEIAFRITKYFWSK